MPLNNGNENLFQFYIFYLITRKSNRSFPCDSLDLFNIYKSTQWKTVRDVCVCVFHTLPHFYKLFPYLTHLSEHTNWYEFAGDSSTILHSPFYVLRSVYVYVLNSLIYWNKKEKTKKKKENNTHKCLVSISIIHYPSQLDSIKTNILCRWKTILVIVVVVVVCCCKQVSEQQ